MPTDGLACKVRIIADVVTEEDLKLLDQLTAELYYGFESVKSDDASRDAGLWQGPFILRKLRVTNELREMLGLEPIKGLYLDHF